MQLHRTIARGTYVTGACAAAGLLALSLAGSASAAPRTGPNPDPQPAYSLPGQGHDQHFRTEAGDILIASGGIDVVNAFGPVRGVGGTDDQLAPWLDRWDFADGTVNVMHTAPPAPTLDEATCSAIIDLRDGVWRFVSGTGEDQGAQGHGKFTELALFSFPVGRDGRCTFDQRGQMEGTDTTDPWMNDRGREIRPLEFSVEVQFVGVAKVKHAEEPCPEITGPVYPDQGTIGVPVCPSGEPTGQPTGQPTGYGPTSPAVR